MNPITKKSKSLLLALMLAIGLSSSVPAQAGWVDWCRNNWGWCTVIAGVIVSSTALLWPNNICNKEYQLSGPSPREGRPQQAAPSATLVEARDILLENQNRTHDSSPETSTHPTSTERDAFTQTLEKRSQYTLEPSKTSALPSSSTASSDQSASRLTSSKEPTQEEQARDKLLENRNKKHHTSPEISISTTRVERDTFTQTLERRSQYTLTPSRPLSLASASEIPSGLTSTSQAPMFHRNWNKLVFAAGAALTGIGLIGVPHMQGSTWLERNYIKLSGSAGSALILWTIQRWKNSRQSSSGLEGIRRAVQNNQSNTMEIASELTEQQKDLKMTASMVAQLEDDSIRTREELNALRKEIIRSSSLASSASSSSSSASSIAASTSLALSSASSSSASSGSSGAASAVTPAIRK